MVVHHLELLVPVQFAKHSPATASSSVSLDMQPSFAAGCIPAGDDARDFLTGMFHCWVYNINACQVHY